MCAKNTIFVRKSHSWSLELKLKYCRSRRFSDDSPPNLFQTFRLFLIPDPVSSDSVGKILFLRCSVLSVFLGVFCPKMWAIDGQTFDDCSSSQFLEPVGSGLEPELVPFAFPDARSANRLARRREGPESRAAAGLPFSWQGGSCSEATFRTSRHTCNRPAR